MEKDLAKAFAFYRANYQGEGRRHIPAPATEALRIARKALAALPGLEAEEAAAYEEVKAAAAIDSRRYAPALVKAQEAAKAARRAAMRGRRFKYAGPVWSKGYGTSRGAGGLVYCDGAGPFRNQEAAADLLTGRDVAQGFYTDSDGHREVLRGYVLQLPSLKGKARFVAAYGTEESGGLTVDLSRIFESDFIAERESARRQTGKAYWRPDMERPGYFAEDSHKSAKEEAARAAQGLAESAAEEERDYQAAWQAGQAWADKLEEEKAARREALALLKERRAAKGLGAFPALCGALRGQIAALWQEIQDSREARQELAAGDCDSHYFWPGQEGLKEAFCDGAGLQAFPS